jgi:hypothetical protein
MRQKGDEEHYRNGTKQWETEQYNRETETEQ